MQAEIKIGYGPDTFRYPPGSALQLRPWDRAQWLSYLDGWAFGALGLKRPAERQGLHEEHFAFGQLEYRKAAAQEAL